MKESESASHSVRSGFLQPHGLYSPPTPLSMGFSRREYWSELPCPSPGAQLRNWTCVSKSPALQAASLPTEPPGKPVEFSMKQKIWNYNSMEKENSNMFIRTQLGPNPDSVFDEWPWKFCLLSLNFSFFTEMIPASYICCENKPRSSETLYFTLVRLQAWVEELSWRLSQSIYN